MQDGIRAVQQAIHEAATPPRFPMYVRQAKQFLRTAIEGFDERKYGFASVVDLLRAAGKEGVLRIERDRQGAVRVFPGPNLVARPAPRFLDPVELDETIDVEVPQQSVPGCPSGRGRGGSDRDADHRARACRGSRRGNCGRRGRSRGRGEAEADACTEDDWSTLVQDGEAACEEISARVDSSS